MPYYLFSWFLILGLFLIPPTKGALEEKVVETWSKIESVTVITGTSKGRPQLIKEKVIVTEEKKQDVQAIVPKKKVVKIKQVTTKVSQKVTDRNAMSEAKNIIKKYEWVRLQAYRDRGHRSIGYGTKSYEWEVITLDEAIRRNHQAVDRRLKKVMTDYPELWANQHAALVSYLYNCPSVYAMMKQSWITEKLWKSCITSKWVVLRGLVKRRADERNLFNQ